MVSPLALCEIRKYCVAMTTSPSVALATELLGEPLEEWIRERRLLGQSFDRLARDLSRATDGKCQFSRELLRRHFNHIPREPGDDKQDVAS